MKEKILTLAISTMGERLSYVLDTFSAICIENIEILILVQKPKDRTVINNIEGVNVICLDSIGLSKSRNAAINLSQGEYIWFLDDDVEITEQQLFELIVKIKASPTFDVFRVQIGCIEWENQLYKKYKVIGDVSRSNMLQISSIEIIAKKSFIHEKEIFFNEKIGLGATYQSCEEVNFLIDLYDSGASFLFINEVFVRHTCLVEGRLPANNNIFEIKGATASRFSKPFSFILISYWSLKFFIKEKKFSFVKSLFKGYFSGYKNYC